MIDENLCLVIIFLIIFVLFYFLNNFFAPKIENYGTYCGRYNLDRANSRRYCMNDIECKWNKYSYGKNDPKKDTIESVDDNNNANGWCGQNNLFNKNILTLNNIMDDKKILPKFLNPLFNAANIFEENNETKLIKSK